MCFVQQSIFLYYGGGAGETRIVLKFSAGWSYRGEGGANTFTPTPPGICSCCWWGARAGGWCCKVAEVDNWYSPSCCKGGYGKTAGDEGSVGSIVCGG